VDNDSAACFADSGPTTAGRKYYIDVYAVNAATNASAAYHGATVRTPGRRRASKKSSNDDDDDDDGRRVRDGRSARVVLKASRPEQTLNYRLTGRRRGRGGGPRVAAATVNIYVRSCDVPPQTPVSGIERSKNI